MCLIHEHCISYRICQYERNVIRFRRKETPVKDTENIQGAIRKEDQNAAVMSYANLTDGQGNNIYENIHENEEVYDSPYEEAGHSHYESSPVSKRSNNTVTINGVSVRWDLSKTLVEKTVPFFLNIEEWKFLALWSAINWPVMIFS